jgi:hypothetical protein
LGFPILEHLCTFALFSNLLHNTWKSPNGKSVRLSKLYHFAIGTFCKKWLEFKILSRVLFRVLELLITFNTLSPFLTLTL